MNSQITGLRVAGILFGLMAMAQLLRVVIHPAVIVAGYVIPVWPSIVAFLVLGGLCYWLLNLTHPHSHS